MRKTIIVVILLFIDIYLFNYLNYISSNKKAFEYIFDCESIIYQTNEIELKKINEFKFTNYFDIVGYNDKKYIYYFDDEYIYIELNNKTYKFKYKLIEPEVIEKIVYRDISKDDYVQDYNQYNEQNNDYFYVNNNYLIFQLNEEIDVIREELINNLNTTYQTSIDYSQLNVSQIGQYNVFYITDNNKIQIIVEIS